MASEGVSDRGPDARSVVRAEIVIVVDQVYARLRPNEPAPVRVELDPGAEITVKVINGRVVRAGVDTAVRSSVIAVTESANAADQIQVDVVGDFGRVCGIDVPKYWAIVEALAVVILRLRSPPVDFSAEANVVKSLNVDAKSGIGTSRHGDRLVVNAISIAGPGGLNRADAEGDVNFLSLRDGGEGNECGTTKGQQKGNA